MSRTIEWPPGSGRVADYSVEELAFIAAIKAQFERSEIPRSVYVGQIDGIHNVKVEFDAVFRPDIVHTDERDVEDAQEGLAELFARDEEQAVLFA